MRSALLTLLVCLGSLSAFAAADEADLLVPLTPPATPAKRKRPVRPPPRPRPKPATKTPTAPTELWVRLLDPLDGARLSIDEREVGTLPVGPLPLAAGLHEVRVEREG